MLLLRVLEESWHGYCHFWRDSWRWPCDALNVWICKRNPNILVILASECIGSEPPVSVIFIYLVSETHTCINIWLDHHKIFNSNIKYREYKSFKTLISNNNSLHQENRKIKAFETLKNQWHNLNLSILYWNFVKIACTYFSASSLSFSYSFFFVFDMDTVATRFRESKPCLSWSLHSIGESIFAFLCAQEILNFLHP
jgi:hypothetical protein